MNLHTASSDIERRTEFVARLQSSNMLAHILDSIQQASSQKPIPGALSKLSDRLLVLVGHDTNLANIGGALRLSWLIDGRRDDTPPGGALVFELRKQAGDRGFTIDAYYTAQSLDQMRNSIPLTLETPPAKANIFIPGCSKADAFYSCDLKDFERTMNDAIVPAFVE
jgi:4-phytase/acid phosphatase